MKEIIKQGKKCKYTKIYKHKCSYCKTIFTYDLDKDTKINGLTDHRLVVDCPNCGKYDLIEWFFGITDKKIK